MNRISIVLPTLALGALCVACPNPADDAPKAKVGETKKAAATKPAEAKPAMPAGEHAMLDLGPESKVMFVGSKVTGTHEGGFKDVDGTIHLTPDVVGSKAEIVIDTTSVYTDAEKLTGHLKSPDFFDVEKYPMAKFAISDIKKGEGDKYNVVGELTLHGVTKSIEFPATIGVDDDAVTAKAEFSINRKDFGIVYAGKSDDLIRDAVLIKLDIVAPKKAGAADDAHDMDDAEEDADDAEE